MGNKGQALWLLSSLTGDSIWAPQRDGAEGRHSRPEPPRRSWVSMERRWLEVPGQTSEERAIQRA